MESLVNLDFKDAREIVERLYNGIDKKVVKYLKIIHRRKGITGSEIIKRYDCKGLAATIYLLKMGYVCAVIINEESDIVFTNYDDTTMEEFNMAEWHVTANGNILLENKRESLWHWIVPIIFSSLSLALGIVNMFLK